MEGPNILFISTRLLKIHLYFKGRCINQSCRDVFKTLSPFSQCYMNLKQVVPHRTLSDTTRKRTPWKRHSGKGSYNVTEKRQ